MALSGKAAFKAAAERGVAPYPKYLEYFDDLKNAMLESMHFGELPLFIKLEQLLVKNDLMLYAAFSQAESSLAAADEQLACLEKILSDTTAIPDFHRIYLAGTAPRDVRDGLPLDGIRKLIASHARRLENMMKDASTRSPQEVSYLEARHANWKRLEELYRDKQRGGLKR